MATIEDPGVLERQATPQSVVVSHLNSENDGTREYQMSTSQKAFLAHPSAPHGRAAT